MHMLAVTETKGFHLDPRTKLLLMAVVATAEFFIWPYRFYACSGFDTFYSITYKQTI